MLRKNLMKKTKRKQNKHKKKQHSEKQKKPIRPQEREVEHVCVSLMILNVYILESF